MARRAKPSMATPPDPPPINSNLLELVCFGGSGASNTGAQLVLFLVICDLYTIRGVCVKDMLDRSCLITWNTESQQNESVDVLSF